MSKPLVRWLIGPVHSSGFMALKHSVNSFRKLYGDEFDYILCCNELQEKHDGYLGGLDIEIYRQTAEDKRTLPVDPPARRFAKACWKLYPPRLRVESHELLLDNDIVFKARIPEIEHFLNSDKHFIVTEGYARHFGMYDAFVPEGLKFNAGFYGIPPNLNYEALLGECIKNVDDPYQDHFDMQGIMIAAMIQNPYYVVSLKTIEVLPHIKERKEHPNQGAIKGVCGEHFVGVNKGPTKAWEDYLKKSIKYL